VQQVVAVSVKASIPQGSTIEQLHELVLRKASEAIGKTNERISGKSAADLQEESAAIHIQKLSTY
jgi:hypothetical protein